MYGTIVVVVGYRMSSGFNSKRDVQMHFSGVRSVKRNKVAAKSVVKCFIKQIRKLFIVGPVKQMWIYGKV
jgi:hypothetical protein